MTTGSTDAGLAEFAGEGLKHLTVQVERDNHSGRRFYEQVGFAESRELTQGVAGYGLTLVEYRRPVLGGTCASEGTPAKADLRQRRRLKHIRPVGSAGRPSGIRDDLVTLPLLPTDYYRT